MNYFSKNENAILNNESFHKDRQSEKNSFLSVKISKEKNLWAKLFLFLKNFFALVCKTCNRFARRAVTRCHRRHRHRPAPHRPPAAPPPQLPKGAAAAEPQQAGQGRQAAPTAATAQTSTAATAPKEQQRRTPSRQQAAGSARATPDSHQRQRCRRSSFGRCATLTTSSSSDPGRATAQPGQAAGTPREDHSRQAAGQRPAAPATAFELCPATMAAPRTTKQRPLNPGHPTAAAAPPAQRATLTTFGSSQPRGRAGCLFGLICAHIGQQYGPPKVAVKVLLVTFAGQAPPPRQGKHFWRGKPQRAEPPGRAGRAAVRQVTPQP